MVIGKSSTFQIFMRGWKKGINLGSEAESMSIYSHAEFIAVLYSARFKSD